MEHRNKIRRKQMAFLHCHTPNCNWSQDDFWDENYTPVRQEIMKDLNKQLFKEKIYFDKEFFEDNPSLLQFQDEKGFYCTGTDYVAWDLERRAKRIRNMLVKTYDEFKEQKDTLKCPKCGKQDWDID